MKVKSTRRVDTDVDYLAAGEASTILPESPASAMPPPLTVNRSAAVARTANRAASILMEQDSRFIQPSRAMRDALLVGFAKQRRTLYGAAYDLVWSNKPIDLTDADAISANIGELLVYEIKSTNQAKIGSDLKGYFFNVTSAELLIAQALGRQYRFAFVNIVTEEWQEMSSAELWGRARAIYPAFHVRF